MSLSYAILANLANRPCSGYDIAKQFNSSVGYFWQATHQQIYRELTKLEAQGWIGGEVIIQDDRPNKKLYSLTLLGKEKLAEWIAQPCKPSASKEELLVKLYAGDLVEPEILVAELQRHCQIHQETLSAYRDIEQQYFQNPKEMSFDAQCKYLTLRRGIRYETDWIGWCEEAIALLSTDENGKVE